MEELAQLSAVAAEADAAAVPLPPADPSAPAPEAAPAAPDFALEARSAVDTFAALVTGYAPAAAPIWDEGAKARISAALTPVMEKYGFTFGSMPPELTLIIVAGPPLFQTSRLIASQLREAKAAKAAPADPAAPIPPGPPPPATGPVPRHAQEALYP